jgi:CspA family cold shock protein
VLEFLASKEWRRGSVAKRTTGVVRWFDGSRGYGYIDAKDGENVFVHYSALTSSDVPLLLKGEQVEFFLKETSNGPQAIDVLRLN